MRPCGSRWRSSATPMRPTSGAAAAAAGRRLAGRAAGAAGSRVYANTINSAANRLAAGLEGLIIPQSEKWHGLSTAQMNDEETDEEKEWAEALRDFLFSLRYSANSNFVPATQAWPAQCRALWPSLSLCRGRVGNTLIRYASIPVVEGYLSRNRWGQVKSFPPAATSARRGRPHSCSATKMPRTSRCWSTTRPSATQISLVECIQPRDERKMYRLGGQYQHLDTAFIPTMYRGQEEIVRESGFRTFPVSTFNWRRYEGDPYGISPDYRGADHGARGERGAPLGPARAAADHRPGHHLEGQARLCAGAQSRRELSRPDRRQWQAADCADHHRAEPDLCLQLCAEPRRQDPRHDVRQPVPDAGAEPADDGDRGADPAGRERGAARAFGLELPGGSPPISIASSAFSRTRGSMDDDSRFLPPESLAGKAVRPTFTGRSTCCAARPKRATPSRW